MTRQQLLRFVKMRNKSGFNSNLQFLSDAESCGFKASDLGQARRFRLGPGTGYEWVVTLKNGSQVRLVEYGSMSMEGDGNPDTDHLFKMMGEMATTILVSK